MVVFVAVQKEFFLNGEVVIENLGASLSKEGAEKLLRERARKTYEALLSWDEEVALIEKGGQLSIKGGDSSIYFEIEELPLVE